MRDGDRWDAQRRRMVQRDIAGRAILDEPLLAAMSTIPRHAFVPVEYRTVAYADAPLPIGEGQTISQPYIVALMTASLRLSGGESVLEIGTGSGYQAAILAELGADVWTMERSARLSHAAAARLQAQGYASVRCLIGDGTLGVPNHAPFDRILASGSLPRVPAWLREQLADPGIFVGPIGSWHAQNLTRIVYHNGALDLESLVACRFVPLLGAGGWTEKTRTPACEENDERH